MNRTDGRSPSQLRPITFEPGFTRWPEGSVLAKFGNTHVLCNVTIEDKLPPWLRGREEPHSPRTTLAQRPHPGNLTAHWPQFAHGAGLVAARRTYANHRLRRFTGRRRHTHSSRDWWLGSSCLALQPLIDAGELPPEVLARQIAAISVGLVNDVPLLDLAYEEDVRAEVDFNVVMAGGDQLVEVQGTAEKAPFARTQLNDLVDLAAVGIVQLQTLQNTVIRSP